MANSTNIFVGKLPKYHHLENIRDKLWSEDGKSRVSVMIGSGFSLNANKIDESLEGMLTWSELKGKILEGLGTYGDEKNDNVLDLSQRYVDEYGRDSLDELIKQGVPDQNYEPGEIHKELLRLPWTDVYTTNYDTLLERTLPNIYERKYQVIYDARDIPNSVAPRIVKLHGSFPSNRPFVFTKNDYDSYNDKLAPLVNMVQQSIMETTFLLVGFSGDDPNFENWSKWVHNNLGEHMPKIYMIAFDENEKENILNERGITLIDFKEIYKSENLSDPYYQMFKDIFRFLGSKDEKSQKDWPYVNYKKTLFMDELEEVIELFINNRKTYPGWMILPDIIKKSNIEYVQMGCSALERFIYQKGINTGEKVKAIKEILWVYDVFQIPLTVDLHKLMKKTVNESLENSVGEKITVDLTNIILRLIKEARLDFNEKDFNQYVNLAKSSTSKRNEINQLMYEKVLMKLIKYEFSPVRDLVDNWLVKNNEIEWKVKKAIVLSRLGEKEAAKHLLENSLSTVRKIISRKKNNNYRFLSIEGIILSNLINLENNTLRNSKGRLSILEAELSNPLKELNLMYSRIKPYVRKTGYFEQKGFDPNQITQTTKFNNTVELELVDSYSLLILNEEFGVRPAHSSSAKDAFRIALNNFENIYPFYSWITYLRIGDEKNINSFFNRDIIYRTNRGSISKIFSIVINGFNNKQNTNLMLEIISRLYFSLLKEQKEKVDKIVIDLYKDEKFHVQNRHRADKIFKKLFSRILFDKNERERMKFINDIYKLPILGDPHGCLGEVINDYHFFFDPFFVFTLSDNIVLEVDLKEIRRLISLLDSGKGNLRDAAFVRLIYLLETDNLSEDMEKSIRSNIADIIRAENSNFSYFLLDSYLVQLAKDNELQERYCNSTVKVPIPKSYDKAKGITSIGTALDKYVKDLGNIFPGFVHKQNYFLSIKNATYQEWLKVFYEWWEDQEKWLLRNKRDLSFGGENDLLLITIFLKNSFLPNIPKSCLTNVDSNKFEDMYLKLRKYRPEIAILLIPVFLMTGIIKEDEVRVIEDGLMDNDSEIYKAAISAIYDLAILSKQGAIDIDLSNTCNLLLNLYRARKEVTLLQVSKVLGGIIHDAPDFFNEEEYSMIIHILNLVYKDLMSDYYYNSLISDQELELLAESTKLAGEIYFLYKQTEISKLEVWKELSESNRLPEVRMHSYLFEKEE